jgi:hypothetical protein
MKMRLAINYKDFAFFNLDSRSSLIGLKNSKFYIQVLLEIVAKRLNPLYLHNDFSYCYHLLLTR